MAELLDLDGISVLRAGPPDAARSILFVGGYGCNKEVWRYQTQALSERHQLIAIDMPGHGASKADVSMASIEGFGTLLNDVRERLGLTRPIIVGHSMGGRVALEASRQQPDKWGGVLLLDVSRAVSPDHRPEDRKKLGAGESHKAFRAHMRRMFEQNFSEDCPDAIREEIRASSKALNHDVANALTPTIGKWDAAHWEEAMKTLQCPFHVVQSTYLIYGQERRILEPGDNTPYFDMIRAIHPDVTVEMIRTGHFSMLEEPDKVSDAIARFAETLES